MRITYVEVSNYRNIGGITVNFHPDCNYIIGENNLGKSNFLSLLSTVCNARSFDDNDFTDPDKPIEVRLHLSLLPNEQGFFGDNFSPDDASLIKIRYQQTIQKAFPEIVCEDSNESIQVRQIRKINFLKYETTSIPNKELRLDSQKGAGLLISRIIEIFAADYMPTFLNDEKVDSLMTFINEHLGKIRSFRDYSIKATVSSNPMEMLTRLFYLSDGDRRIDMTGSGVQYIAMASLNILCQIMELYKGKSTPFVEQIYTDDNGKKLLPLVLSIDEPEVHLHPYLQRSLIGYYRKILCNGDVEFAELLKSCFDVDGIDGQLIIVTHSTDALVGDYRNIIRFYKDNEKTAAICGYALQPIKRSNNKGRIKSDDEKHLIMHFPEIKEAFYSKCALLIEGETEYGCIKTFAEKTGVSLDDCGICVINARGEGSIKPLRRLLSAFSIPSVAIYDGDVKPDQVADENEFYTQELCFEIEIVKSLYDKGRQDIVKKIASEVNPSKNSTPLDYYFVRKPFCKMGIDLFPQETCEKCGHKYKIPDISSFKPKQLSEVNDNNKEEFCRMYSAWLLVYKGVMLGRIIGNTLPFTLIPDCYKNAIIRAKKVAANA